MKNYEIFVYDDVACVQLWLVNKYHITKTTNEAALNVDV